MGANGGLDDGAIIDLHEVGVDMKVGAINEGCMLVPLTENAMDAGANSLRSGMGTNGLDVGTINLHQVIGKWA